MPSGDRHIDGGTRADHARNAGDDQEVSRDLRADAQPLEELAGDESQVEAFWEDAGVPE